MASLVLGGERTTGKDIREQNGLFYFNLSEILS